MDAKEFPEDLLDRTLTEEEIEDQSEAPPQEERVTFHTQDYPVDGLVKRLERGTMLIPQFGTPDDKVQSALFQRKFVWTKKQMDRFIESLLLGYPVPGIFLVKQAPDNKLLVLDGQQRLETLRRFYSGIHNGREFRLENVSGDFKNLTYRTLPEDYRNQLDDSFLTATIVAATDDDSYEAVYQIFERLNAGGTNLTPHEVRVALFPGELMSRVAELNDNTHWRYLYGNKSTRLRDHELVLRILALSFRGAVYQRPLKSFLNSFTSDFRKNTEKLEPYFQKFESTAELIRKFIGPEAIRRPGNNQVNAAQAEAIFVSLMRSDSVANLEDLKEQFESLIHNQLFVQSTTRATADSDAVFSRLQLATEYLTTPAGE
ncbi:DUF262 domain-containing protein [Corynebacterium sp. H128]|uniref:DUF262 domain-containing protein n=1 Tax=unclassified Corynebacterium TaxID=2624378 RepID=UPI00309DA209